MVCIYSVGIINKAKDDADLLHPAYELSSFSFWQRPTIKSLCTFVSVETVKRCADNRSTSLEHNDVVCYASVSENIGIAVVTDAEYPARIILTFMNKIMNMYIHQSITDFDAILKEYQNIKKIDQISAIQSDLDETVKICRDTIDKLCLRENELSEMIKKTDELLEASLGFRDGAQDLNKCCMLF